MQAGTLVDRCAVVQLARWNTATGAINEIIVLGGLSRRWQLIPVFARVLFFFSSRRRHTRFDCDWSSDVCSSDLEVEQCPVCGKDACAQHRAACGYCGRHVCTADLEQPSRRCATCAQLATIADPPEHVVTAARAVMGAGAPRASRAWRIARDKSHLVEIGRAHV